MPPAPTPIYHPLPLPIFPCPGPSYHPLQVVLPATPTTLAASKRFVARAETTYATPKYALWKNASAVLRHIDAMEAAYDGFWGPYDTLSKDERAPIFEMPPQPWDKAHRPALVAAQVRAFKAKQQRGGGRR